MSRRTGCSGIQQEGGASAGQIGRLMLTSGSKLEIKNNTNLCAQIHGDLDA